jgi:thiol-disulfide isomerase/thioredoxin
VANDIDHERRRFLSAAAMTIVAAHVATLGTGEAAPREPRELAALGHANEWLNSPRLTPESLSGKVVLVDFWTYTCINWLRTLPYVRAWAKKYKQSLVVVGVHTPEFAFEHDIDNVRRAVRQMQIEYPVAVDNDYAIWRAFDNHYWPALYIVDARDLAPLPCVDRRPPTRAGSRDRCGRGRQRHGRRTAPVPTDPPAGTDPRSTVRDRVPRPWRRSVRVHVRLTLAARRYTVPPSINTIVQ